MSASNNNGIGSETTKVVESTTVKRTIAVANGGKLSPDAPTPSTTTVDAEDCSSITSTTVGPKANTTATTGGPSTSTRSEKRGQIGKSTSSGRKPVTSNQTAGGGTDADQTGVADGCLDLDVKKMKKEPKSSPPTDGAASLRQAYQTFPASSYLQGLTALAHPYAGLFTSDPSAVAPSGFLTDSHFAYQSASTDLQRSLDSGKSKENLIGALNQVDASALRHLIIGYREAAALLNRTADELENFLCTRK